MKRIFYNTLACCAALLALAACEKTEELSYDGAGSGTILINISSKDMTRAEAKAEPGTFDFEDRVDHLDVLIFAYDENNVNNEVKIYHERIQASSTPGENTVALKAKRSDFKSDKKYWVYVIANANDTERAKFEEEGLTRSAFLLMERKDPYIHLTGMPSRNEYILPQTFLMDGAAYDTAAEPMTEVQEKVGNETVIKFNPRATPVTLYDGVKQNDTQLTVNLRRAAVKLELNLTPGTTERTVTRENGEEVTITTRIKFTDPETVSGVTGPNMGNVGGYYMRNMPYVTRLAAETTYGNIAYYSSAPLRTPYQTRNHYFDVQSSKPDLETDPTGNTRLIDKITVTVYTYAHDWTKSSSTLEREPRWIVDIPLQYITTETSGTSKRDIAEYTDSYYQILVSKGTVLERNKKYIVNAKVSSPGGANPSEPIELKEINYSVKDWVSVGIPIGGEENRPKFLTVNRTEMEMHETNVETREINGTNVRCAVDKTSVEFASSSKVTAKVTRAYYIDKFGNEVEVSDAIRNAITLTPSANLNGILDIVSPVPVNNTARYINVEITNEDGMKRELTITQYAVINISNIQGSYSYRSDFGGTTWENYQNPTEKRVTAYGYTYDKDKKKGTWKYSATEYGGNISLWKEEYDKQENLTRVYRTGYGDPIFFTSMVAEDIPDAEVTDANKGKSTISRYMYYTNTGDYVNWWDRWKKEWKAGDYFIKNVVFDKKGNARMYHVEVTATSGNYTIGRPRITSGKTDSGVDNAMLVSPSFLIASQLGVVPTTCFNGVDDNTAYEMAASHCEQYVEVARNKTVYENWRLPTAAEIGVILDLQYNTAEGAAMDEVMTGYKYYSASGIVINEGSKDYDYERDENGKIIRDENGNPVIKKDENDKPVRKNLRFLRCVHDLYKTQDNNKSAAQEAQ